MLDVEQWAEIRRMQQRRGALAARDPPPHRGPPRHDPQRARLAEPPALRPAAEAPLEARPLRRRDRAPARRRADALGRAHPRGDRRSSATTAARRSSTTTCASCGPASCRRRAPTSAPSTAPASCAQFDLWEPQREIPVGWGQTRRGYDRHRRAALLARLRRGARLLEGVRGHRLGHEPLPGARSGRLPREAGLGPRGRDPRRRRPPDRGLRRLLRPARARLDHPRAGDCRGQGRARAHPPLRARQLRGRAGASPTELDFQAQLDDWCDRDQRRASTARPARSSAERLAEERERMRPLPEPMPDTDRRFVMRVPAAALPALRPQRLLARPAAGRAAGSRSALSQTRDHRGRARHAASSPPATAASSPAASTFTDPAHQRALERAARRAPPTARESPRSSRARSPATTP